MEESIVERISTTWTKGNDQKRKLGITQIDSIGTGKKSGA
jgi:hypothetical protein